MRGRLLAIALHALLGAGAVLVLLPLVWMVSASLSAPGEAFGERIGLLPSAPTLEHYRALFVRLDVARYLVNSAAIAAAVTGISLFTNSLAGYAFAKLRFAGREPLFRTLLAALVVPAQVATLPLFLLVKQLGLVNTYAGVVIPGLASVFGIFLMRQWARSIPDSLLDAARIDGAGELRIYLSLVLRLARPVLLAMAIVTFLGTWNDFLWPLIVLTDADLQTLPVALANLMGEHAQDTELMMAGAVITVLPVTLLFLLLQRRTIEGLAVGSVRG
jgi:multiple sugar transport system permease protein